MIDDTQITYLELNTSTNVYEAKYTPFPVGRTGYDKIRYARGPITESIVGLIKYKALGVDPRTNLLLFNKNHNKNVTILSLPEFVQSQREYHYGVWKNVPLHTDIIKDWLSDYLSPPNTQEQIATYLQILSLLRFYKEPPVIAYDFNANVQRSQPDRLHQIPTTNNPRVTPTSQSSFQYAMNDIPHYSQSTGTSGYSPNNQVQSSSIIHTGNNQSPKPLPSWNGMRYEGGASSKKRRSSKKRKSAIKKRKRKHSTKRR
jgi:hypothetical protein